LNGKLLKTIGNAATTASETASLIYQGTRPLPGTLCYVPKRFHSPDYKAPRIRPWLTG